MKIDKINTYAPQFGSAKISAKSFIPVINRGESYPPKTKFMRNVRDILGEIFPKLDPDYDLFVKNPAKNTKNSHSYEIINKVLMAIH